MKSKYAFMFLGLSIVFPSVMVAHAQMNNRPFSFKGTPDGGIGMSIGGQQAIINQKILGVTPGSLVRGANGVLLDVVKGPGNSVIVSDQNGGGTIPAFKGASYKGDNASLNAGVFNPFFVIDRSGTSSIAVSSSMASSSAAVSTWTTRVVTNGYPASYSPNSEVDTWTSLVFIGR